MTTSLSRKDIHLKLLQLKVKLDQLIKLTKEAK